MADIDTYSSYLASDEVDVFPTAKRLGTAYYQKSRLMSEDNIIKLINRLTNNKSFVISDDVNIQENLNIYFNIYGYLFTIKGESSSNNAFNILLNSLMSSEITPTVGDVIVATISRVDDMLYGTDENSQYTGVSFMYLQANNSDTAALYNKYVVKKQYNSDDENVLILAKLVEYEEISSTGTWETPEESLIKFAASSLDLSLIDGGTLA